MIRKRIKTDRPFLSLRHLPHRQRDFAHPSFPPLKLGLKLRRSLSWNFSAHGRLKVPFLGRFSSPPARKNPPASCAVGREFFSFRSTSDFLGARFFSPRTTRLPPFAAALRGVLFFSPPVSPDVFILMQTRGFFKEGRRALVLFFFFSGAHGWLSNAAFFPPFLSP